MNNHLTNALDAAIKTQLLDPIHVYELGQEFGCDTMGMLNKLVNIAWANIHQGGDEAKQTRKIIANARDLFGKDYRAAAAMNAA